MPTSVIPAHAGIQSPATVVNSDWRRRSHFHPLVSLSQPAWAVPAQAGSPIAGLMGAVTLKACRGAVISPDTHRR